MAGTDTAELHPASMSAPDIVLRIAIVGAGISGLSNYLFLKKHLPVSPPHEIRIYETYPCPSRKQRELSSEDAAIRDAASFIGGGLGVAPNGMRILRELDPEVHDAVVAQGYPTIRFQIKSSHNWTLGSMPTVDVDKELPEVMIMSMRQGVWDCLREKVPEEVIQAGKAVSKVERGRNDKPILCFADGTVSDEFNLVIGSDGVKSVVKNAVTQAEPIYEGLCGIGGFFSTRHLPSLPSDLILPAPKSPVVMTFGAEGFFGYAPCDSDPSSDSPSLTSSQIKASKALPYGPQAMWWSTFSVDEPPKSTKAVNNDVVKAQLLERHSKWQDPVIQKVLADPVISVMTATFVTPKLSTWTGDGIVLVGDAAHTLPSTSGQGVSQALEDAQALSLLLARYLRYPPPAETQQDPSSSSVKPQIQAAITAFQSIRKPRVEYILDSSRRMAGRKKKMGPVGEWITYFFMWALCTFFPGVMRRSLGRWDVSAEIEKAVREQNKKKV
jgi:2-polyprenyl-6-methoxyphenol hydroxylase-like FAD-dependent oxidoreductase